MGQHQRSNNGATIKVGLTNIQSYIVVCRRYALRCKEVNQKGVINSLSTAIEKAYVQKCKALYNQKEAKKGYPLWITFFDSDKANLPAIAATITKFAMQISKQKLDLFC